MFFQGVLNLHSSFYHVTQGSLERERIGYLDRVAAEYDTGGTIFDFSSGQAQSIRLAGQFFRAQR